MDKTPPSELALKLRRSDAVVSWMSKAEMPVRGLKPELCSRADLSVETERETSAR